MKTGFLALCVILFALSCPCYCQDVIKPSFQLVEGGKEGAGTGMSFQFDGSGVPAVSYYDLNSRRLKYARVEKGRWVIEDVASCGAARDGLETSLTFDKANVPYVAFHSGDGCLALASRTSGAWSVERVDGEAGSGLYCSLALLSGGEPVISYQSARGTMAARKVLGAWTIEKIDGAGSQTVTTILPRGDAAVYYLYSAGPHAMLKAAELSQKGWVHRVIPGTAGCRSFDVAFGEMGTPTIAYVLEKSLRLYRESVPGSGVWKEEVIDESGASRLSVTLKRNGLPVVVFIAEGNRELKVARQEGLAWENKKIVSAQPAHLLMDCHVTLDRAGKELILLQDDESLSALLWMGEKWAMGRIDGRIRVGGYVSLALRPDGSPVMGYYDYSRKEIHLASRGASGEWSVQPVEPGGQYLSMVLDQGGNPCMTYVDHSGRELKFARFSAGRWQVETVDRFKDTGRSPSLVLDRRGVPHVSYRDGLTGTLKHAFKQGSKWHRKKVAGLGEYGGDSVILIDGHGKLKIVFTDGTKAKKVGPEESPVQTFLKTATPSLMGTWKFKTLLGPYAVGINESGLSAHAAPGGEIAISCIDRDGNLRVFVNDGKEWRKDTPATQCLAPASIRHHSDGSVGVLFLSSAGGGEARLHYATLTDGKWTDRLVDVPLKKIRYLSLTDSPTGRLRFACGDQGDYFASYFEQPGESGAR